MVHGHPVKYRANNLAGACHGFLRKFLELIVHRTAVLTVRIHLPPAESLSLAPSRSHTWRTSAFRAGARLAWRLRPRDRLGFCRSVPTPDLDAKEWRIR